MPRSLTIPHSKPTSVGTILREEFMEPLEISQTDLAKAMGVGRKTVNELCGDRRGITPETAFLLAKVLGTTPEFWLNIRFMTEMWEATHSEELAQKIDKAKRLVG